MRIKRIKPYESARGYRIRAVKSINIYTRNDLIYKLLRFSLQAIRVSRDLQIECGVCRSDVEHNSV